MNDLNLKIQFLERQNEILVRAMHKQSTWLSRLVILFILTVVVLAGGAMAVLPNQDFDTITAKVVKILDADGRTRIVLNAPDKTVPDTAPKVGVTLYDETGYPTTGVLQFSTSCGFWASRYGTDRTFALLMSNQSSCGLDITAGGGNYFPVSAYAVANRCGLNVRDPSSANSVGEISFQNGTPAFGLYDQQGSKKVLFTLDNAGKPITRIQESPLPAPQEVGPPPKLARIVNNNFDYRP
jgi:hypothetical protein